MLFICKVRSDGPRDQSRSWRTIFLGRKILVEVISGRLCMELLTDAGDVLFGESCSCKAVETSQRFDLRRLRKEVSVGGVGSSRGCDATERCAPGQDPLPLPHA